MLHATPTDIIKGSQVSSNMLRMKFQGCAISFNYLPEVNNNLMAKSNWELFRNRGGIIFTCFFKLKSCKCDVDILQIQLFIATPGSHYRRNLCS